MSDDYLWDRSGPPDPEVARLERLLAPLRQEQAAPPGLPGPPPAAVRLPRTIGGLWSRVPRAALPLAAAAILVVGAGLLWRTPPRPEPTVPGWAVERLEGAPTIASQPMQDLGSLPVGGSLVTDAAARARVNVNDLGYVDVDPETRVDLIRADGNQYRLRLARGTLHAIIVAPPGQFVVETPSSTAVDLGCAYTLTVDEHGAGTVRVTSGWVAFEWRGRESFIPAGAMCATRPRIGPGTPHYEDVSENFEAALEKLDFDRLTPADRTAALSLVLAEARERDAMTLWHLLVRAAPAERDRIFDRLAAFVPPPDDVTREGVLAGDRQMLDRWWDALGLDAMSFWRIWKQRWDDQATR